MKKTKIIVYHNTIKDKKVYIFFFINKHLDFDKAKEILNLYSSSKYIGIDIGTNAIIFIERKENFNSLLLTTEEFKIGKIMIMSIPDLEGNLYDVSYESEMKIHNIKKAVMFEVEE